MEISKWFPMKMLVFTLVTLYVLLTISSSMAYMGTRYGKRESDMSRLELRSIGQRSIANRGARFYPGSRYGGKRSGGLWQIPKDSERFEGDGSNVASSPFSPDCIRLPFVRVRCNNRQEEPVYDDEESNGNVAGGNLLASSSSGSSAAEQP